MCHFYKVFLEIVLDLAKVQEIKKKQVCIPVGCVPPGLPNPGGSASRGICQTLGGLHLGGVGQTPPL